MKNKTQRETKFKQKKTKKNRWLMLNKFKPLNYGKWQAN